MLLPSALSCESRPYPRLSAAGRLFSSTPPPSDESFVAGNGLLGTCRALQSLLNASPASSPRRAKPERLESPLQMQQRPNTRSQRVAKPTPNQPRGINKRRRDAYEDEADPAIVRGLCDAFTTPKRQRRAPLEVPFGLEASDFKSLDTPQQLPPPSGLRRSPRIANSRDNTPDSNDGTQNVVPEWTSEDDKRLVELVLDKLKLSKRDWNDCARKMGKDHDTVGRRWKALIGEGNVGLRRGKRIVRGRITGNRRW